MNEIDECTNILRKRVFQSSSYLKQRIHLSEYLQYRFNEATEYYFRSQILIHNRMRSRVNKYLLYIDPTLSFHDMERVYTYILINMFNRYMKMKNYGVSIVILEQ